AALPIPHPYGASPRSQTRPYTPVPKTRTFFGQEISWPYRSRTRPYTPEPKTRTFFGQEISWPY
ncbi:MAG: hypothetical protein H6581_30410, partial [Bacteroidia bacterium]|nr:hypothetical protein [Bacteroidia bacterium]